MFEETDCVLNIESFPSNILQLLQNLEFTCKIPSVIT